MCQKDAQREKDATAIFDGFSRRRTIDDKLLEELDAKLKAAVNVAERTRSPGSVDIASKPADNKATRAGVGMSQSEFRSTFHLSLDTLKGWEQDKRSPDAAVASLLRAIKADTKFVQRTLAARIVRAGLRKSRGLMLFSYPERNRIVPGNTFYGSAARPVLACLLAACSLLMTDAGSAQELVPRAYWPAPVGTNVALLAYQRNDGDIVIDPSLPITGVESEIDYLQLGYQRFFGLLGRTAAVQLSLPYANGFTQGLVEDDFLRRETTGPTDARLRMMINLRGAPAMDAAGFQALRAEPRTIIGASMLIQAPTGDYDSDRVINLGTNRWAVKPALGVIVPLHPTWLFEIEIGAWFFGDNDEFLGETREQDPIVSTEVHLIKRFRPGFWASLDTTFYLGGETRIGTELKDDLQRNSRAGFTLVFPVKRQHALRAGFSAGITTRSGGDFEMYSLGWTYAW